MLLQGPLTITMPNKQTKITQPVASRDSRLGARTEPLSVF